MKATLLIPTIAFIMLFKKGYALLSSSSNTLCTKLKSTSTISKATTTIRQRHPILPSMSTQYTINDEVCSPVDEGELRKIVQKHCRTLDTYQTNRPIAAHTKAAFDAIYDKVDPDRKVILDSGCGTGRSSVLLGEKFPDHTIIGIDRSFVRLNRNSLLQNKNNNYDGIDGQRIDEENENSNGANAHSQRPFQAISSNVFLVRAELTDFWRCCLETNWNISHHYILYPNPYPKKNRIKKRFYAHPSFPLILKLGGEIVVRSNWEGYLKEFAQSVVYAHEYHGENDVLTNNIALPYYENALQGPKERTDKAIAWTNFEKKYDDVGEKTYELIL